MKRFNLAVGAVAIAALAHGCASGPKRKYFRAVSVTPAKCDLVAADKPSNASASVGDIIISSWPNCSFDSIETLGPMRLQSETEAGTAVTIPAGVATYFADESGSKVYRFKNPATVTAERDVESQSLETVILMPSDPLQPVRAGFEFVIDMQGRRNYWRVMEVDEVPSIREAAPILRPAHFQGFGQTLTYLGVSGGKIRFSYDEFSGELARPAFKQEIELDYAPEQPYAYKNARFVVHEATPMGIRYSLLQNF